MSFKIVCKGTPSCKSAQYLEIVVFILIIIYIVRYREWKRIVIFRYKECSISPFIGIAGVYPYN